MERISNDCTKDDCTLTEKDVIHNMSKLDQKLFLKSATDHMDGAATTGLLLQWSTIPAKIVGALLGLSLKSCPLAPPVETLCFRSRGARMAQHCLVGRGSPPY